MKRYLPLALVLLLTGCQGALMRTSEYQGRQPVTSSLIKADQEAIGDEVIQKILSSRLLLPAKAKIATLRFGNESGHEGTWQYGVFYWRSEGYLKLQQEYVDTIGARLQRLPRVVEVAPLPSLMVPERPTVPSLREAAVRMQADLLLVYRITSDRYQEYVAFGKDRAKAYCTVEMLMIDTRTGLIPFTTVITRDELTLQEKSDTDINETAQRAERLATTTSLGVATDQLVAFLAAVP